MIKDKTGEEIAEVIVWDWPVHISLRLSVQKPFETVFTFPVLLSALDEVLFYQGYSQRHHPSEHKTLYVFMSFIFCLDLNVKIIFTFGCFLFVCFCLLVFRVNLMVQ